MKNIIEKYKYNIKKIIKNITGVYDEDLEQEVYIKAWKNLSKYKEQNKFKQWISTITSNICKDFLKSKTYQNTKLINDDEETLNQVKDNSTSIEKELDSKERQKIILDAINRLPKKLKETVFLYEFEDKTYEEIAKKIKVPEGTVKSRLYNARKILSIELKDLIGD